MGFHGEALLAPGPNPKLEDHPLSALRDCLFNLFTATLHIGGRSSILNLRTRHAVVTGTHLLAQGKTPRHIRGDVIKILQKKIPNKLNGLNTFS